jgi:deoxyribonuclease-4
VPGRGTRPPVGAHVRVSGGLARAGLTYARAIGAEAVQVFVSNPRGWACASGDPAQDHTFRVQCAESAVPAYVHAPYLVNFGSPTERTAQLSVAAVRHCLQRGRAIGARGVVVHTGSAVAGSGRDAALRQVRKLLLPLVDELSEDDPDILLEPTAGQGSSLCATVGDIGPYLAALEHHPRVGLCLDTCHAFAAGHDLSAPTGVRRTLDALVRTAGQGRLRLIHANDSKDACGSFHDRHERIGRGRIGAAAFAELLHHPAVLGVPVVVETPGGRQENAQDVALLQGLRDGDHGSQGQHRAGCYDEGMAVVSGRVHR